MEWANNEQWKYPIIFGEHAHIYLNHKDIFQNSFCKFCVQETIFNQKSDQIYTQTLFILLEPFYRLSALLEILSPKGK